MAALNFPANPVDGELYPDPALPGVTQYIYSSDKGTWLTVFRGVARVDGEAPIFVKGNPKNPLISIAPATQTTAGSMSAADKKKLDEGGAGGGTVNKVTAGAGLGAPATGDSITTEGTLNLLPPTPISIGGIKQGEGTKVDQTGTITLAPATQTTIGGVKQGTGVVIAADGSISLAGSSSFQVLDQITFDGTSASFQLKVQGVPYSPPSIFSLLLFVGGILQAPLVNFSLTNASTVTFVEAPPAGTSFYGISLT
jgi:hypothetical protein